MIVDDERPNDGKLLANPEFLRFAAHWGFRIRACRPYRARLDFLNGLGQTMFRLRAYNCTVTDPP